MVSIVPSRFAGLKIDDDDDDKPTNQTKSAPIKTGNTQQKKQVKPNNNKKPNSSNYNKQKSKNVANNLAWEEWQTHDQQFLTDCYQRDLEEAILQSKLQAEAQEEFLRDIESNSEGASTNKSANSTTKKKNNKKKKSQPMNLQEFNKQLETVAAASGPMIESKPNSKDDFFKAVDDTTKSTVWKEINAQTSTMKPSRPKKKPDPLHTALDILEDPELSKDELEALRVENEILRKEVDNLKQKLKKATNIVAAAEMKEKIDLLREIQSLRKVHNTMADEMSALYVELEQEKTKANSSASGTLKKSVRFDVSNEVLKN